MLDFSTTRSRHPEQPSRRDIDVATGILIALRGYSESAAFAELVEVVHHSGSGITTVARALIAIAGGRSVPAHQLADALSLWGERVSTGSALGRSGTHDALVASR